MFFSTKHFVMFLCGGIILLTIGWIAGRRYKNPALMKLLALGALYPFGEVLQQIRAVPSFIRWHVSDFGFVPLLGFGIMIHLLSARKLKTAHMLLTAVYVVSVLQELGDHILYGLGRPIGSHRGDSWDVLMYTIAYILSLKLVTQVIVEELRQWEEWKRSPEGRRAQRELTKKRKKGKRSA